MSLEDISIILPTKNEESNIINFLTSIPDWINLIVVDSSRDSTREIIKKCRPFNTNIIHKNTANVTEARQIGAEAADSHWLLFTDADIEFDYKYFDNLQELHGYDVLYDVVYGPKLSDDEYKHYYRLFTYGQQLSHFFGIPAASGSNLLINHYAFDAVGGFDTDLSCNEDSEIVWRLKKRNYQVKYNSKLIVYANDHRRLENGLLKKTLHTMTRCFLLYSDVLPQKFKSDDWGYWENRENTPIFETN